MANYEDLTDDELNTMLAREAKIEALKRIRSGNATSQILVTFGKASDDDELLNRRLKEARVEQLETRSRIDAMVADQQNNVEEVLDALKIYQGRTNV